MLQVINSQRSRGGVGWGGGGGWLFTLCIDMHCVTLAIFVFPVMFICIFISAHQHWYFVHPVCMITVLCVSPYFYCNLEMNIM